MTVCVGRWLCPQPKGGCWLGGMRRACARDWIFRSAKTPCSSLPIPHKSSWRRGRSRDALVGRSLWARAHVPSEAASTHGARGASAQRTVSVSFFRQRHSQRWPLPVPRAGGALRPPTGRPPVLGPRPSYIFFTNPYAIARSFRPTLFMNTAVIRR